MIDPLQFLAADPNVDANMRQILAGQPLISHAISEFSMLDRIQLIAAIEGAIAVLGNTTDPHATAAATILKGALRK